MTDKQFEEIRTALHSFVIKVANKKQPSKVELDTLPKIADILLKYF